VQRGPGRLGMIVATTPEATLLSRRLRLQWRERSAVGSFWSGALHGHEIVLIRGGIGPRRATQAAAWLVHHDQLCGMLSVGFAGGLQTHLATGDAILATQVLSHSSSSTRATIGASAAPAIIPHADWLHIATVAAAQAGLNSHRGPMWSTDTMIAHAAAKQCLGQQSGALAVDMESYSIGQVATHAHLPFGILRTIFDTAVEDCLLSPERCMTPDGALQPLRLLAHLGGHPHLLMQMPHVWGQARAAGQRLQHWVQHFLMLLGSTL
jgi:adenosylhomocysteine nucleosidase